MPPPLLCDPSEIDFDRVLLPRRAIYDQFLPHRHEFMLVDRVCLHDPVRALVASVCDVRADAWWVRGHVPRRPLMPGVLMLEAAAQTATINIALQDPEAYRAKGFMGFGGVEDCKFRDAVVPPAQLRILCVGIENRPRRFACVTQGLIEGRLVFEAKITGVVMGKSP